MKIAIFVLIGAILFFIDWWFLRTTYRTFWCSRQLPDVVAPIRFIGSKDDDGLKGQSLAVMLSVRLGALQHEARVAQDALRNTNWVEKNRLEKGKTRPNKEAKVKTDKNDSDEDQKSELIRPSAMRNTPSLLVSPDQAKPIELKARVVDIPKLDLKVSGVDVSGIVTWAYRKIAEGRAIRIMVNCPAGATTFDVAIDLDTEDIDEMWLKDIAANDVAVVNEVALAILRLQSIATQTIPEAAGLDRTEFGKLIDALRQSAELNGRIQNNAVPSNAEYAKVVSDLETIIARTPRWRALLELTASAAQNSRDLAKALSLYERSLEVLQDSTKKPDPSETGSLNEKIADLRAQLDAASRSKSIIELLQVPTGPGAEKKPRVGILGGTPLAEQLSALGRHVELLGEADSEANPHDEMGEHVGAVASVIRMIAPETQFVFASMRSDIVGSATVSSILKSLDQFADAKLDVLVIPLNLDTLNHSAMLDALKDIAQKCVVVLPAGNEGKEHPAQFSGTVLRSDVITAGAVDKNGNRAVFSSGQADDQLFWAPGVNIPVRVWSGGRIVDQLQSGTSYSAALAGGAAAILLAKYPDLAPANVIKVLKDTSRPRHQGWPALIQIADALKMLEEQQNAKVDEQQNPKKVP